jgi:hypothetical protein
LSVGVAASAMPSRRGDVIHTEQREQTFGKDADAYRRLRRDGLQPPHVDGSHRLEARADRASEVESGALVSDFASTGG